MPIDPIKTVESLREHLWDAAAVEFSTIPLYLYTMYSLKTGADYAREDKMTPLSVFRGIAIEEMLHLSLVRNMYIAIGGSDPGVCPRPLNFYDRAMMPAYPSCMLHRVPALCLSLRPYSVDQVKNTFMEVELPDEKAKVASHRHTPASAARTYSTLGDFYRSVASEIGEPAPAVKASAAGDAQRLVHGAMRAAKGNPCDQDPLCAHIGNGDTYHTLGEFYRAIMDGFVYLNQSEPDLFAHNNVNYQIMPTIYYSDPDAAGAVLRVVDLDTALACCQEIMDQGEGHSGQPWVHTNYNNIPPYADPNSGFESAHYYKFAQMGEGIYVVPDNQVWPAVENPRSGDYPAPVRELSDFFNACYCFLLVSFDQMFNTDNVDGEGRTLPAKWQLMQSVLAQMQGLLYRSASLLMSTDIGQGNAAPTFEYFPFDRATAPKQQLQALYAKVVASWPILKDWGVDKMVDRLPDVKLQPGAGE
jgi:hypothetical protein